MNVFVIRFQFSVNFRRQRPRGNELARSENYFSFNTVKNLRFLNRFARKQQKIFIKMYSRIVIYVVLLNIGPRTFEN